MIGKSLISSCWVMYWFRVKLMIKSRDNIRVMVKLRISKGLGIGLWLGP